MKLKYLLMALIAILPATNMAQKKKFTIDDLIPGGATYYQNTVPENRNYTWWGSTRKVFHGGKYRDIRLDECIQLTVDSCIFVENETGVANHTILTLDRLNESLAKVGKKPIMSLYDCEFIQGNSLLVKRSDGEKYILNTLTSDVIWSATMVPGRRNDDLHHKSLNMAFTVSGNLYVQSNGHVDQVTKDGGEEIVYGEAVHRNEFGIDKGTFWNPSGSLLAFYKMDQSMVTSYPQVSIDVNGKESNCAQVVPDKYPMAGEAMHKVYIGIYNVNTRETLYLNTGDPTDRYFTNIVWSPDSRFLYVIELNRDQTDAELVEYDAETGEKVRTVLKEHDDKYVEPMNPIRFLPWDASKFIYVSRCDGYNHLYLYNTNGKMLKQLTSGNFEVIDVLGFNDYAKTLIYTSNEKSPIQKNVYKVDMKGKRQMLGNANGWHNPKLSPSGEFVCDNYSTSLFARHIDIINTETGYTSNLFSAEDKWQQFNAPKIMVGTIKAADGVTDLYYRLILPTDFDPNKKYPAVVYVYGGPHAHNVDASFHYGARGWDIWMAQNGYVMFCLDNRGSEHRGRSFEQATFRNLGVEEMKDQMKGVDFLKSLPYVDSNRLGVHGWSFGGFMTASLMSTYPDVFKVGVAGGPVIDWKFYEVMYGERYMDTPQSNPEGYKNTSLLNKAKNLKGRLMVIYGGNDPVCVPQHTLSFIRACIDNETYPDLFTYPGDEHNMYGTDRIHLHNVITRYFDDHLK